MCGRFTATWPSAADLLRALGVSLEIEDALAYRPRWNVAPMDRHFVVRLRSPAAPPVLSPAQWGLLHPAGADRPRPHINARSETAARLPTFRDAFQRRRCVVPVDGFYEWVGPARARRPVWFHDEGGGALRLAGLWEPGSTTDAPPTFTILTTAANDVVAPVHDRMPVVLAAGDVDRWLHASGAEALALLRRPAGAALAGREVSPRANRVENDDPACLDPWVPTEAAAPALAAAPARPARRRAPPDGSLSLFDAVDLAPPPRPRRKKAE